MRNKIHKIPTARAIEKCTRLYGMFLEYEKYGYNSSYWENKSDPIVSALRLLFGSYHQKGACFNGIDIGDYARCLSSDFGNGALIYARNAGYIPMYNRFLATKYGVEKGCAGVYMGGNTYGFE